VTLPKISLLLDKLQLSLFGQQGHDCNSRDRPLGCHLF
jgi:hypothetical protein